MSDTPDASSKRAVKQIPLYPDWIDASTALFLFFLISMCVFGVVGLVEMPYEPWIAAPITFGLWVVSYPWAHFISGFKWTDPTEAAK